MTYIICEGPENSAEGQFVKAYITERVLGEVSCIFSGGNRNIMKSVYSIPKDLNEHDSVILFFDSVETIGGRAVIDILDDISEICNASGTNFRYTTYYCFEEIFLSYAGIVDLLSLDEELHRELLRIQDLLRSGKNYYDVLAREIWSNLIEDENCYCNREHFSFVLINQLMKPFRHRFQIEKGSMGKCWTCGCAELEAENTYYCPTCRYRMKDCEFGYKLRDIEENSVFAIA